MGGIKITNGMRAKSPLCNLKKMCGIVMKTNLCNGFLYETEEELRDLVGIEEYLDMEFDKGNGDWEPGWDDASNPNANAGSLL